MSARAFSLVEVMASVALLSIGLIAGLSAYNTAATQLEHQRHTTIAINSGEAVMEELLLMRSSDPLLDAGTRCVNRDGGRATCDATSLYTITWQGVPHARIAGVREITVTTRWLEGITRHPRAISFTTQRD